MEGLEIENNQFWRAKRVLVTGHTGFKGSWMCLWLQKLGAKVVGFSLPPPTTPSLFRVAHVDADMCSVIGDVRDYQALMTVIAEHHPEIVIHMAAQSLVRVSYVQPVETYAVNVMGSVHLLEAIRQVAGVRAVINVTSDKCYENREWIWGYREDEPMGGYDPYSSSKGCSELVTAAFRSSYFNVATHSKHGVALASARAGNVIGGGDWAQDRLVPDIVTAFLSGRPAIVRNPAAVRPWQHVLEPVRGYLTLAKCLWEDGPRFAESWNFGPNEDDVRTVESVVNWFANAIGDDVTWVRDRAPVPHEARYLRLDTSKARAKLGWRPWWNFEQSLEHTLSWYQVHHAKGDMRDFTLRQITEYESMPLKTTAS